MTTPARKHSVTQTNALASSQDKYIQLLVKRINELETVVQQHGAAIKKLQSLLPRGSSDSAS